MSAALIIFGSYLAISPGIDIFGLPKMLCICLGTVLVPWKSSTQLRTPFLLLIGAALVSVMASDTPIQGLLGHQGSATYGVLGMVVAWMAYEAGCGYGKDASKMVLRAAGLCAIIALAQCCAGSPVPLLNHRAYGTAGSPPFLGVMLALALPLAYKFNNLEGVISSLIIVGGIIASGSRAGIIGALAGILWMITPIRYRLCALLAPAAIAVLATLRAQGDTLRLSIWPIAYRAFKEHPWLGVGPDCFGDSLMRMRDSTWPANPEHVADNAHNLVLHVLSTTGILGAIAWINLGLRAPMTPSVVAVLAYSLFNPVPFGCWAVLGFMWGANES